MDPKNPLIKLRAGYKLLRKKLGFRYLMDVIPLDATLIKGSHGRIGTAPEYHPVLIGKGIGTRNVSAVEVYEKIWQTLS